MKRVLIAAVTCFSLLFTACFNDITNITLPKEVKVSSHAKYRFTITELDMDLSQYLNISTLMSGSLSNGIQLYDYNPGGNQQKQMFLIRVPIQEIPLDFGSFMANTDLGSSLSAMSFEQEIEIPSVNINTSQEFDIAEINSMVNLMVSFTGAADGSFVKQQVNFASNFDHVIYNTGSIIIQAEQSSGVPLTGKVRLYTGATLSEAENNKIAEGTLSNGQVTLNIDGKTLYGGNTFIAFENAGTGFVGSIATSSLLKSAHGVTSSSPVALPQLTASFPVGTGNDSLEECTFGTGSTLSCIIATPDWQGVSVNKTIALSGGLNTTITGDSTDLGGVTFTNEDIDATLDLTVSFSNADIYFNKKPKITMSTTIPLIQSVRVKLPDGTDTSINVNQDLPDEAKSMVHQITWKEGCGIKVKYTNTFPSGNDFTLKNVSSTFLGLTGTTNQTLEAGKSNQTVSFLTDSENITTIGSTTKIDFRADLDLPGATAGKIIATNVEPGKKYKVMIEVTPVLDWKEIEIDSGDLSSNGKICMDFNLGSMFSSLDSALHTTISDKINLCELPIHLYCDIPNLDAFNNPNFAGKIKFFLADSSENQIGSNELYVLGSNSSSAVMPFAVEPALNKTADDVVISTVTGGLSADISLILNASASVPNSKLGVDYNIGLTTGSSGTITINHDALQNASNTTIKITAMVILPLELNLTGDVNVDIIEMMGVDRSDPNWDVMKRTEATSLGKIEKLIEIIDNVSISYAPTKKPFISSSDICIVMDMDGAANSQFETKVLSLNGGKYAEDPTKLLNTYPLQPEVNLLLKAGQIAVPRAMGIKSKIDLGIDTNGKEVTVWGGSD